MSKISKRLSSFSILLFLSLRLYAQGAIPAQMTSLADQVLGVFTSGFVTTILAIMLCGAAVAYAYNRNNDNIKAKCIAVLVAGGIIISAQGIVNFVM